MEWASQLEVLALVKTRLRRRAESREQREFIPYNKLCKQLGHLLCQLARPLHHLEET